MRVHILQQPFSAQGKIETLGYELDRQLRSGHFREAFLCSAFVMSSGTSRLLGALRAFAQRGGAVHVRIGLRNGLTSVQAVRDLLSAGARVQGFHTGGSVLFHPKSYLLVGPRAGWLAIGSSNLTSEGMYRNFETNTIVELDLTSASDLRLTQSFRDWWNSAQANFARNLLPLTHASLPRLVRNRDLIDERTLLRTRIPHGGQRGGAAARPGAGLASVPPIPIPHPPPAAGRAGRPRGRRPVGRAAAVPATPPRPTAATRYFAMTLSDHDCSKRTGIPGTPEISLPDAAVRFFPGMQQRRHMYPDAYFEVMLNSVSGARPVEYRAWRRPGGARGHADLRINVKHETVDLTAPGGGDLILFERTATPEGLRYEVWIVKPSDQNYSDLRRCCNRRVTARGAGGIKYYGFF